MSNRSMIEINHDCTPHTDEELLKWAKAMKSYLSCGNPKLLPQGVTWFGMRHHSEPCPLGYPPRGPHNNE